MNDKKENKLIVHKLRDKAGHHLIGNLVGINLIFASGNLLLKSLDLIGTNGRSLLQNGFGLLNFHRTCGDLHAIGGRNWGFI